jgi:hypothetical protein
MVMGVVVVMCGGDAAVTGAEAQSYFCDTSHGPMTTQRAFISQRTFNALLQSTQLKPPSWVDLLLL